MTDLPRIAGSDWAHMAFAERLEAQSIPEPNSGCWLWTGLIGGGGYGVIKLHRRAIKAHRASYIFHNGNDPGRHDVCHRCDERSCINPDHLFVGTRQQNVDDMMNKGRNVNLLGERHGRAKLTADDVLKIRACTDHEVALAAKYGVTRQLIRQVRLRKIWRHI